MVQDAPTLPPPSPEHRRIATGQFERANQVIANGDFDYGIRLLLDCCKLDPANLIYRQTLRRTQKRKFNNNMRGSVFAWLTTAPARARVGRSLVSGDYLKVLLVSEQVLTRNPWHVGTQMSMAEAAEALGLLDLAVWTLEQARQKAPRDNKLNRILARLHERRGNFTQAIALWEIIRKENPADTEAANKAKDLAARDTIARGHYESAVGGTSSRASRASRAAQAEEEPRSGVGLRPSSPISDSPTQPLGGEPGNPAERRLAREVSALQARIDADPTNANSYLQLAALHRRNGQLDQARNVLHKGVGPTGNNFELTCELADLDIEPFRQNLALTQERMADNSDEELRRIRIRLLKEINSRELELYRQKTDRYPTDLLARFELGVRLLRANLSEEAIRELQQARSDPRVQWKAQLYLGHCFKGRNNWRLARRNFEEALSNVPADEKQTRKEIFYQLAIGCADAGELSDAVQFGNELANLDFSYKDIGQLVDSWQTRLKQAPRD